MTYFFDHNVSWRIAKILRLLGVDAIWLTKIFPPNVTDAEWIGEAGKHGWIVVTTDKRIRTVPPERRALEEANVTAVFLYARFPSLTLREQALWTIKRWPDIEAAAADARRGTALLVPQRGSVRRLK